MFSKKSVGVDIADHTIEIAVVEQSLFGSAPRVVSRARTPLEPGVVEHGRVVLQKQLHTALRELMNRATPLPITARDIIFGLPERQIYTSVLHIEPRRGETLDDLIMDAARQSIPLEPDDLVVAYRLMSGGADGREVLLYGASKEVMAEWEDFFSSGEYRVRAFDHELLAISRGLYGRRISSPVCIVDIGAERTKIAVFSSHGLHYVHAVEVGGDFFTSELARTLDVSKEEAERMKREEGMEPVARYALYQQLLEPIIAEITVGCDFFDTREQGGIQEVVLVGGSARLIGLPAYVQEKTRRTCRLGSPAIASLKSGNDLDHLHYIEATGLALKGLDLRYWEKEHPSLLLIRAEE